MNFELIVRTEFVAHHMAEGRELNAFTKISYLNQAYKLIHEDIDKWNAINTLYNREIIECLDRGVTDFKNFKLKHLLQ